jgi:pyrimidine-nucleoside phosphorylase
VIVPKMSGRGLGITGGTLDKLESIPGFRVDRSEARILDQIARIGIVIGGQTPQLAPADAKLYALRDVTATVGSLPLIVSSILSKKIAGGAPSIVLDVKAGSGALVPTAGAARELAESLVEVGRAAGRRVVAYVTNMGQPLGRAVGNAVEVREAIETLRGDGPPDLVELATTVASEMALLAGVAADRADAMGKIAAALRSGAGLEKLRELIAAQGGDARVVDDPGLLPTAPIRRDVPSPASGYVAELNAGVVGETLIALGAGRARKTDAVDPRIGAVLHKKVGDEVSVGEPLFTLHLVREDAVAGAAQRVLGAYRWSESPVPAPAVIIARIPPG